MQHARSRLRTVLRIIGIALLAVIALALLFVLYLTVREYRPDAREAAWTSGSAEMQEVPRGAALTAFSFNIGYAGLGAESDFIMDGGKETTPASETLVEKNLAGISETLMAQPLDFALLQETDVDSKRSYGIDERARLTALFGGNAAFAPNYVCDYVPFPLPDTIGRVESGLLTLSRYPLADAARIALPVPFSWPVRAANLKRCLLVSRIPVADSDAELVLIDLHLEAYDDGAGKRAQTEQLVQLLQAEYEAGNYVVAGGDFNQRVSGFGAAYPVIDPSWWQPGTLETDMLPDDWRFAFDDAHPTCRLLNQPYDPSDPMTQYYVIDGFLCSPNVLVESVEVIDAGFVHSDHNPVLLRFSLG